jgi:hypothetical protein
MAVGIWTRQAVSRPAYDTGQLVAYGDHQVSSVTWLADSGDVSRR